MEFVTVGSRSVAGKADVQNLSVNGRCVPEGDLCNFMRINLKTVPINFT